MEELLLDKLKAIIDPITAEMNLVLVDLSLRRYYGNISIEILADKEFGGITIEECTALNRRIGQTMEEMNLIAGSFNLEVSSPGLDRPLKTKKDFVRTIRRPVRFFLAQPVAEKLEHAGTIEHVEDENVLVNINGEVIRIPINIINKAKQII